MNLQSALIVLGLVALAYIIVFSYLRGSIDIFKKIPYFQRLISASSSLLLWVSRRGRSRSQQGEPSLVSAGNFRLDPDPSVGSQTSGFDVNRKSANARVFESYIDNGNQEFQRILKIDYWARLPGTELVNCHDVLALFRTYELDLEHPHRIHGLMHPRNAWVDLEDTTSTDCFYDLIVSVQMADRHGPITVSELTRTNNLVYELSEKLDRKLQFDMTIEDALTEGRLLDNFCKRHDVLVIVNVVAKEEQKFSGKDIQRVADSSGMQIGDMGMFHFSDSESSETSFTMGNRFEPGALVVEGAKEVSTAGLILFMSIPLVSDPLNVFDKMISVAQYVAFELSGDLQDPDGSMIDHKGVENIRNQVISIGEAFHRVGILPGSAEALRLF